MQTETKQTIRRDGAWQLLKPVLRRDEKSKSLPREAKFKDDMKVGMKRGVKSRAPAGLASLPPTLLTTPSFAQTLRFMSNATSVRNITVGMLANAAGGIAATSILFYPWSSAVRLKKVTIWPGEDATSASVNQCAVTWASQASGGYAPERELDASVPSGMTLPRRMVFRPPKLSLALDWLSQSLAGDSIFQITSPIGSVVDVEILCRMSNNFTPFPSEVAAGATAGSAYWGALDTATGTGGNYPPVGRPQLP